jgi:hypothetical protein
MLRKLEHTVFRWGGGMDIHKPKAAHSLREFAIEIGTIICGILIALGLEQAVEWNHQQKEVAETREALRDEVSVDMRAAQFHMADDACLERYYAGWMAWARGAPKPALADGVAFPEFPAEAWAAARSRAVAHMPLAERLAFTRFYGALAVLDSLKTRQADTLMDFNGYRVFDRLEPEQGRQVLVILARNKAWRPSASTGMAGCC